MDGLELLDRAYMSGLQVTANGDQLVVRGPRSAEPLALDLLDHKHDVLRVLAPSSCACSPMRGPAIVGRYPSCPRCARSGRCPSCEGCRACGVGCQPGEEERGQDNLHRRLQAGQHWLAATWSMIAAFDTFSDLEPRIRERYLDAQDLWVRLEMTLRSVYAWEGRALGPGLVCASTAPVVCHSCTVTPHVGAPS